MQQYAKNLYIFPHFIVKNFKHTAKSKRSSWKPPYAHHLESTIVNILLHLFYHIFIIHLCNQLNTFDAFPRKV